MAEANRARLFGRLRDLPVVGRAADWGMGPHAVSKNTKGAGSRIAGLKVTESVCPYCASVLFILAGLAFRFAWVGAGRTSALDHEAVARMARVPARDLGRERA